MYNSVSPELSVAPSTGRCSKIPFLNLENAQKQHIDAQKYLFETISCHRTHRKRSYFYSTLK